MERLKIVSVNRTHSQEDMVMSYPDYGKWLDVIEVCIENGYPLYVHPSCSGFTRAYFVEQTLDSDGYVISGDYETVIPELGKVKYSIWNEKSDYYKSLFPPISPKSTFYERNEEWIKACIWVILTVFICVIGNNILKHFGIDYDLYLFVVGALFGIIATKNEQIKRLRERL